MDSKEALIQAATELLQEKGDHPERITVREICKRAGVGLGLVNYHFGSKEKLLEVCVERMINGIVQQFLTMREEQTGLTPFAALDLLGNLTLNFLFNHAAVSKISILTDMQSPKAGDNTDRTYQAYLPLVAACRPDWDKATVQRKTFTLISMMQQLFVRSAIVSQIVGMDLQVEGNRQKLHTQLLHDILEV